MIVAYLKVGPQVRMYSDYLRATREAGKEDSIELPHGPRTQTADGPPKSRATSFFPLRKLKGNQPLQKSLLCTWHILKKRKLARMKVQRVMILVELRG